MEFEMTKLEPQAQSAAITGLNVLLVEDDDDDADILKSVLMNDRRVADTVRAANGEEALAWLERTSRRPDLIIVDLNMPILDGFTFLTRMRMLRGFKGVPVAVLTSSSHSADYHKSLIRRADTFITKPDDMRSLTAVVGRLLDHLTSEMKLPCLLAA
jgi:DNA-binding response OmpR family regulator